MSRIYKCKCKVCGTELTTDIAYKTMIKGKNTYYCNEGEYLAQLQIDISNDIQNAQKRELFGKIRELIGEIEEGSIIYSGITNLHKHYSYTLMYSYLYNNQDYISKVMSKNFINSYAKGRYFLAILSNNLPNFEIPNETIKYAEYEIIETKYKAKAKRRSMQDIESEVTSNIE